MDHFHLQQSESPVELQDNRKLHTNLHSKFATVWIISNWDQNSKSSDYVLTILNCFWDPSCWSLNTTVMLHWLLAARLHMHEWQFMTMLYGSLRQCCMAWVFMMGVQTSETIWKNFKHNIPRKGLLSNSNYNGVSLSWSCKTNGKLWRNTAFWATTHQVLHVHGLTA